MAHRSYIFCILAFMSLDTAAVASLVYYRCEPAHVERRFGGGGCDFREALGCYSPEAEGSCGGNAGEGGVDVPEFVDGECVKSGFSATCEMTGTENLIYQVYIGNCTGQTAEDCACELTATNPPEYDFQPVQNCGIP